VEVQIAPQWRKSSYSGNGGGDCVEVAGAASVIMVRDTKRRDSGALAFTPETWRVFTNALK
jgi:hypothetical protein